MLKSQIASSYQCAPTLCTSSYQCAPTLCIHYCAVTILCVDMLTKYCKKDGRKLELFARNLLPDWTSWGNEV